ncbi:hypothetical protein [Shimazuella alba]|uniref:Uncharacterized protein n=1 Tax=Shimazuella alba TaxID=2690964 RepID=A0A6I4VTU2_9BACL|nr:hypothetical protein [Shimazuella alba]MXQ53280.1 hypothetical protein [Shimazuella alba]
MARRIGGLSKRERLIIQARRMKLRFKLSISENELENLINRQPITEEQRDFVNKILQRFPGKKCPEKMTYGQFRKIRTIATENDNEYAIEKLNLEEGKVIEWGGEYYLITKILSDRYMYKMVVQKVNLHRRGGCEGVDGVTITPIGDSETIDPCDVLFFGGVIDLNTWQPEVDFWGTLEGEPAF